MSRTIFATLLAVGSLTLVAWQKVAAPSEHEHPVPERLGTVKFTHSCSANVQPEFQRAVALLHSFGYSGAEKAYRDLIAKDPNCAMADCGDGWTYLHHRCEPHAA